jgi:hypothetical protein
LPQQFFAVADVQSVQSFALRKKGYGGVGVMTSSAELRNNLPLSSEALSTLGDVPIGLL